MPVLNLTIPATTAKSYPILIEQGLLNQAEYLHQYLPHQQICIVTNKTIAPLYLHDFKSQLQGKEIIEVILEDGEQFKNIDSLAQIFDELLAHQFHRDCALVALGGGVVGDMAGFAAACYQRGAQFVQVPTTLLAQVDSSVGGKTGVNHPLGKNMIGAFHQPEAVIIDTNTLSTLPEREFSAGLGEVIKYGLINDLSFFEWLENNAQAILNKDGSILAELIAHCCANKARIVEMDEKEQGQRALLNLGHTFGHALEALTHYQRWKHGEAVGIGIMMAAHLSHDLGNISAAEVSRIQQLLEIFQVPTTYSDLSVEDIYQSMFLDKKVKQGKLRLVLMQSFGQSYITADVSEQTIKQAVEKAKA